MWFAALLSLVPQLVIVQRPAHAIDPVIWAILLGGPLEKGLNQIFYPDRRRTYPASAPTVELRLPDPREENGKIIGRGLALPPWKSTRQQELIVRKSVVMTLKPGVNGPPLRVLEMWIDSDKGTLAKKTEPPWEYEINTAKEHFQVGGVYTIGMRYDCGRRQEGFNAIQVTIADDSFIRNAWELANEEYRAALATGGLATVPAIPVATSVTPDGKVVHLLGNGMRQPLLPNGGGGVLGGAGGTVNGGAEGAGAEGGSAAAASATLRPPTRQPAKTEDSLAIKLTREDNGEVIKDGQELVVVDGEPVALKLELGKAVTKVTVTTIQGEEIYGKREYSKLERINLKASATGKGGLAPLEGDDPPYLIAVGVQDNKGKRREFRFKVLVYAANESESRKGGSQ